METWFITLLTLSVCIFMRALLLSIFSPHKKTIRNPPGPLHIPIISRILWLRETMERELVLETLFAKHGPILTLHIGLRPAIFIADRALTHQALVQKGSLFSDRPKELVTARFLTNHTIFSTSYGATWRTLRRNLTSEMLHSSRVKSFSRMRKWVLHTLLTRLKPDSKSNNNSVKVIDHFHYAMFSLLVFMCFGERLDDGIVMEIERVQRQVLLRLNKFKVLNFWPIVTRVVFRKRWEDLLRCRNDLMDVMLPLIRARKQARESTSKDNLVVSYVDTLLDLDLPEEKRKLNEEELVSLCSEFLCAGTDTTSTMLQWIMANLVKYPHVQERVVNEIREVLGEREEREVKEEDLQKLPYLKAVILEVLRRHPPGHYVLEHAVTEDVIFNDYLIPKNGTVNFALAEMGWDPKVWKDPMEFKPERFLNDEGFDITGTKEIKMMPFGVGRRFCPGYNLAMLHLLYFVANLVWNFQWTVPEGGDVDFSEKKEFTIVMKNPLQVHLTPRI